MISQADKEILKAKLKEIEDSLESENIRFFIYDNNDPNMNDECELRVRYYVNT
mgnify:CR=1 FL=1